MTSFEQLDIDGNWTPVEAEPKKPKYSKAQEKAVRDFATEALAAMRESWADTLDGETLLISSITADEFKQVLEDFLK